MPNSVDRADPEFVPGNAPSDIVTLLYRHPDEDYSPSEVAEQLGISADEATSNLVELRNQGFVGQTVSGCYHFFHRSAIATNFAGRMSLRRLYSVTCHL